MPLIRTMRALLHTFLTLLTIHWVSGLSTNTRFVPKTFTKHTELTPLKKAPSAKLSPPTIRDYSDSIPVVYTNDLKSAEEWVSDNLKQSSRPLMLGWDMESTPQLPWLKKSYTEDSYFGPATLQLSTATSVLVLQIAQDGHGPIHEGGLPRFIHDLLLDPTIIPVGVGIDDDFVELYRWCLEHGEDCAGPAWALRSSPVLTRFDMGGIGVGETQRGTIGLARLVEGILGVVLFKTKKLARTHWSRKGDIPLTDVEINYAARDAWAGAAILERLQDLDPDRFHPSQILQQLEEQVEHTEQPLRSIQLISNRKLLRKVVKEEWKPMMNELKEHGDEMWNDAQRERYEELTEEMKRLAPTPSKPYEITQSLGLKIP